MKIFKLLTILLIFTFVLPATMHTGIAYIPNPEEKIISVGLMASQTAEILEGSKVEIIILIKNFSNASLNNVTITQTIHSSLTFLESPYKAFNGTTMNYTDNVSIENQLTKTNISLNYLSINKNNFTMNLDKIENGEEIRIQFSVNVTEAGTAVIPSFQLVYFDKYGDKQPAITVPSDLILSSLAAPDCEKCPYFENIDVDDIDWLFISLISLAVLAAGILSRSLYKKKPIKL